MASGALLLSHPVRETTDNTASPFSATTLSHGLVALGLMATVSLLSTALLLAFILNRMLRWPSYYKENLMHNQYVLLIIGLLFCDFFQALAFVMSWYWLPKKVVGNEMGACFAQGFLIHFGDVGSAFFVLAIAAHTCFQVGFSRRLDEKSFNITLALTAVLSLVLTVIAPIMYGSSVYVASGAWCWIAEEHENLRLGTHYIWIFVIQGLCFILYGALFWKLSIARKSINSMNKSVAANDQRIKRAAYLMAIYPIVYVGLTLPLAASRMALYAHRTVPEWTWIFAGCLMTSCGWVDCLLYAFTRRALLKDDFKSSPVNTRNSFGGLPGSPRTPHWLHRHGHKHDSTDMFGASIHKGFHTSKEKSDGIVHVTDLSNSEDRGRFSDRTGLTNDSSTAVDPHSPPRSPSQVRLKHNSADIELGTFYNPEAGDGERDDHENGSMSSESPIILQQAKGSRKTSEDNSSGSIGAISQAITIASPPKSNARAINQIFRKSSRASSQTPHHPMSRRSPPNSRTRTPDDSWDPDPPTVSSHQHNPSIALGDIGGMGGITVEHEVNVQSRPKSEVSSVSPNHYFQSGAWARAP